MLKVIWVCYRCFAENRGKINIEAFDNTIDGEIRFHSDCIKCGERNEIILSTCTRKLE